jgi:hypothetical protein
MSGPEWLPHAALHTGTFLPMLCMGSSSHFPADLGALAAIHCTETAQLMVRSMLLTGLCTSIANLGAQAAGLIREQRQAA